MAGRRLDPKAYLLFTILLFTLYLVRYHLIPAIQATDLTLSVLRNTSPGQWRYPTVRGDSLWASPLRSIRQRSVTSPPSPASGRRLPNG